MRLPGVPHGKEASARNRVEVVRTTGQERMRPQALCIRQFTNGLYRLPEDVPGLGAHLFGHRHGFKVSKQRGTTFVNVSALDPWATRGATVWRN